MSQSITSNYSLVKTIILESMIHDEICTYEVCKLAKKKGFPIEELKTWHYDYDGYSARRVINEHSYPHLTQSLLQRWLREKKNIHIEIIATASGYYWCVNKTNGTSITDSDVLNRGTNEGGCFDTYEPALEDALKYALENFV